MARELGCPEPPDFALDFEALDARHGWIRALRGCEQDAEFHPEGDVWIHTRMVCQALCALDGWRALPPDERALVFGAALLHDVAKPETTRREGERVTARGHARRGEQTARLLLWRLGAPFAWREALCALVLHHQVPFFLLERDHPRRLLARISLRARCDHLALLAEADARGRTAHDVPRLLENIALFFEYARDEGCLRAPRGFASDHARFLYFQQKRDDPDQAPYEAPDRPEVTLLSGLPGAGKDHFVAQHGAGRPVISLDALRAELGVSPSDSQGKVVAAAREAAREHLRAGRAFVWNATNISRQQRAATISLCADYDARVQIVYLEVDEPTLRARNQARRSAVPDAVIDRLLRRWQPPDASEAHRVQIVAPRS
ncbi:MAG: AAA family ATPase [Myxococcales bacterium]|nr:AAA family ATPase [Myxococcales bacterium]